jgi:predicted CXXCH cytochrome family protein
VTSPLESPSILAVLAGVSLALLGAAAAETPAALGAETEETPAAPEHSLVSGDCASCHAEQAAAWEASHHYRSMLPANEDSVFGDFDERVVEQDGRPVRFFRENGGYFVETEGEDGAVGVFEIAYTFGYDPLQQYLVALPDGRLQALTLAWDKQAGVWFDLYPEQAFAPGDDLHWTGQQMTWNYICADCHSTNLRRNFVPETGSYETTFTEVNVGCLACHGEGAAHVAWARGDRTGAAPPMLLAQPDPDAELRVCGPCHARRQSLSDSWTAGAPIFDHYVPEILREALYYPDGQIEEEVFVYGSFLQSRMHRAGVTCSNCHEPHSGAVRAKGNAICTQCHSEAPPARFPGILPLAYDSPAHHFHEPGSEGARCVSCHMPERTYMLVDPRRDHSFRVPRPDLSDALGTPNACIQCHADRSNAWAAETVLEWYGPDRRDSRHFGEAIHLGRTGAPGAAEALEALGRDETQPAIARATAFNLLGRYLNPARFGVMRDGVHDPDPLIRVWTLRGLDALPIEDRPQMAGDLLTDPTLAVRSEAALFLAPVPDELLTAEQREVYGAAARDFLAVQAASAERAEAQHSLGVFHDARGEGKQAEAAYRKALERDPGFVPAYANLAERYRQLGDVGREGALLRRAVQSAPEEAAAHFALGLYQVRARDYQAALASLERATELDPDSARFAYVHAVALDSLGQRPLAIENMTRALERHPWDPDLLRTLAILLAESGEAEKARPYAQRLVELDPFDPDARGLLLQLKSK